MRNTIAKYKESLSRIASDVLDDGEEVEIAVPGSISQHGSPFSERRFSSRFSQAGSPVPNGVDFGARSEIDPQRAEIDRLQASEAEIKALAINYAAILKEKEEQLSRLHGENSSLRRSLEAKNMNTHVPRDEGVNSTKNNSVTNKGAFNQSPSKQHRHAIQVSPRSIGNGTQKENISNQGTFSNGHSQATFSAIQPNTELLSSPGNGNELASVVEENKNVLAAIQANHESEIKQLKMQLEKEHEVSANLKLKFEDAYELNETSKNELLRMKSENERTSVVMKELQKKLDMKISEITQLQSEQNRRNTDEKSDSSLQNLKTTITTLEKDNARLKVENDRLNASMEHGTKEIHGEDTNNQEYSMNVSNNVDQEKEEMIESIHKLKKMFEDTCKERDKAQRELARLKQHLLDKELEESDKMDEDSKTIEELRGKIEYQKLHILKLEKALKHEMAMQEDVKNFQSEELQKLNDINSGLKQKLEDCMGLVDAKNIEVLNLQTALGQYYAESEAKERLERDLAVAREGSTKLSELLNVAKLDLETSIKDKEELHSKLLHNERLLSESKHTVQKLQEDNSKLHRAVEQSMTRINRLSMDSDYHVDRRIVIKLLVTYFQRNHSKEVLDLMVRMLGFSDEDKRRIGFAQQAAGKTVVRGVLGLPGRLVGGILGGRSSDVSSETASENQSFADLWVDFLLKDAEQREKEESIEANSMSSSGQEKVSLSSGPVSNPGNTGMPELATSFPSVHTYTNQLSSPLSKQTLSDPDAEFANVPLTSSISPKSGNSSQYSRLLPKY